jgi:hypothetical protein
MIGRTAAVLMIVAGVLLVAPADAAEPPAGLVMELTGSTTPPMQELTEIPADTPIRLGPGAQLTFLHYRRCKVVTVAEGSVTLSGAEYQTDGRVTGEKDSPCPRVLALADSGNAGRTVGGVIMRGVAVPPRWPVDPQIVFAGDRAAEVRAAAIYDDSHSAQPLIQLTLSGRRARSLPGAAAMAPNARYTLRLTMADQPAPVDVAFIATAQNEAGALVIVRVD